VSKSDKSADDIIQKLHSSQSGLHNAVTAAGDIISEWDRAKTFRQADKLRKTKRKNKESDDELMREKERLHEEYILKQRELDALIDENKGIFRKKREKLNNDRQAYKSFAANIQTKERELHVAENTLKKRAITLKNETLEKRNSFAQRSDELEQEKKRIQSYFADLQHEIKILKNALHEERQNNKSLVYRCRKAEEHVETLKESLSKKEKQHTDDLTSLREELSKHKAARPLIEAKLKDCEMKLKLRENESRKIIAAKDAEIRKLLVNEKKPADSTVAKIKKHKHQKKFKCSVCNIEVPENAKFCPGCGEEFQ